MPLRWPWVSRLAFDTLAEDRDRLREQNDHLIDKIGEAMEHMKRMDRLEHGVMETPRAPRPDIGPMPPRLLEHCNSWASPAQKKIARDMAYKRRRNGESWEHIMETTIQEDEQDD
jgi:hypothetical protein